MNQKVIRYLCLFLLCFVQSALAKPLVNLLKIYSPDKKLLLTLREEKSGLNYTFQANDFQLISKSAIGLNLNEKPVWKSVKTKAVNQVWKPIWGKRKQVADVYNEAVIDLANYQIKIRVYNNGIAFKYENGKAEEELTQFNFADNFTAWYYNYEEHNIGPEKLKDADSIRMPVMTIKVNSSNYMAVHEAALESGQQLKLQPKKGTTLFTVASKRSNAWRVVLYGKTPGELVDSHLIELLNPDPDPSIDFSWVKTGLAVWDWRINGAEVNGFKYKMSLLSWKRMVDFAAENNIHHLVLDADWYGPEFQKESDPLKGGKVEQVHQLIAYGKEKNVGIWLYLNDVGGKAFPLEETIKQYGRWGAVGIKYGFMQGNMEEKNANTRLITQLCAQNHLMVDFHDIPVHPYGQMRTWPNAVTREFCQAQLDARRVFQPKTFVTTVFVNMIAGPIDMNNGTMDMMQKGRVDNPMPVPATITAETARTLITFSGATILPDIPENYNKHPQLLKFISAQKMPWQESKTISGEIGEYIVMSRKASDGNWLIAAATNENARTIQIPLSMLEKGTYEGLVIEDGKDADYITNKESYKTAVIKNVLQGQIIEVKLAPGGGACILLQKKN